MVLFSGQEWIFQQDSVPAQKPRRLRSGCGELSGLYQRRRLALGEPRPQPRDCKLWLFWRQGLPKALQQPGQSEEIPRESGGTDPPGEGACRDNRVAGASQGLRRGRRRPC